MSEKMKEVTSFASLLSVEEAAAVRGGQNSQGQNQVTPTDGDPDDYD